MNVVWTFTLALPATGFHGWRRIGELAGSQDIWFSRLSDQIEVQFAAAEALITEYALPYLDTFASIESLVTGYERGSISGAHAFGGDSGWRALNLGLCYAFLGRRADAEARLKEVVEVHSDEEFDFVMERKRLALAELERLDRT